MYLVIMGVSGCGKTTVGEELSAELGWPLAEADDYHPISNKRKMAQGVPLTDEDRIPWLIILHRIMCGWKSEGSSGIVTCSALKKSYREILCNGGTISSLPGSTETGVRYDETQTAVTGGTKDQMAQGTVLNKEQTTTGDNHVYEPKQKYDLKDQLWFIYLKGSKDVISSRIINRKGHFMPPSLLDSQFATLEEPSGGENNLTFDVTEDVCEMVSKIIDHVHVYQ